MADKKYQPLQPGPDKTQFWQVQHGGIFFAQLHEGLQFCHFPRVHPHLVRYVNTPISQNFVQKCKVKLACSNV